MTFFYIKSGYEDLQCQLYCTSAAAHTERPDEVDVAGRKK